MSESPWNIYSWDPTNVEHPNKPVFAPSGADQASYPDFRPKGAGGNSEALTAPPPAHHSIHGVDDVVFWGDETKWVR